MGDDYDGGAGDGNTNAKTLCAQGLLAFSGGYGLSRAYPTFAGPAFSISLLSGCVGVLTNLTGHDTLISISRYTSPLSRCFVTPLMAAETCCANGIQIEISALNLLCPTVYYVAKYLLKKDDLAKPAYLEVSQAISVCAIAYFTIREENWWGVGMALAYALSCFGQNILEDIQSLIAMTGVGTLIYTLKLI